MFILFFITLIDLIGFGMVFPLFPMFKLYFGFSNIEIGYIASLFAIAGIFGSLFWGFLSDKFGRKYTLALPMLCLAIIYYATGQVSNSISFMILRFLSGFFAANFAVAFAAVSDLSKTKDKFKNMGILGSAFGLGFVLGPAMGGFLAGNQLDINLINFSLPFDVAAIFNMTAGILTLLIFKETYQPKALTNSINLKKKSILQDINTTIFHNKYLLFFIILTLIFTAVMSGAQVFLGIWLNRELYFTPRDIGLYWSFSGLTMALVQFNVAKILKTKQALVLGFSLYAISMAILAYTHSLFILLIATTIMTIGIAMISPSINTKISFNYPDKQGLIFGFTQALSSLGRVIGPNILALLFTYNHQLAWLSVSLVCVITTVLILWIVKKD